MNSLKMLLMAAFSIIAITAFAQEKAGRRDTARHTILYSCKMHPDVKMDKAGKCPQCGMELVLSPKEKMARGMAKSFVCPVHADVVSKKAGKCSKCSSKLVVDRRGSKQVAVEYTCSMHPLITSDKPGKCPKCNMNLVEKKKEDHSGHQH